MGNGVEENKCMQTLINEIENNIYDHVNVKDICGSRNGSNVKLCRYFYNYTGHTISEYIRKRRLSNALSLVKISDLTLDEIADTCGYSSRQAFCRSVKSMTGQTPTEYRNSDGYFYFPVFYTEKNKRVTVAIETIPATICVKYYAGKLLDIEKKAITYFKSLCPDYKGRMFGKQGRQHEGRFCYELYLEKDKVDKNRLIFSDFRGVKDMPEVTGNYAKSRVPNDTEEINKAWNYLEQWQRFSMFRQDDLPYFEEYFLNQEKSSEILLYLPVVKRNDSYTIQIKSCDEKLFLVSNEKKEHIEEATEDIVNYLKSKKIYFLSEKELYEVKKKENHTYGIQIGAPIEVEKESGFELVKREKGVYAILEGYWCETLLVYRAILYTWLKKNGFQWDKSLDFAVYTANEGPKENSVITKVYVKLKNVYHGHASR